MRRGTRMTPCGVYPCKSSSMLWRRSVATGSGSRSESTKAVKDGKTPWWAASKMFVLPLICSKCLLTSTQHANLQNFPRLREVLTRLLFDENNNPTVPEVSYPYLPPEDRIAILTFMCDVAISSKAVHQHMEQCEEQLTALRKEKIEVNRQKKS